MESAMTDSSAHPLESMVFASKGERGGGIPMERKTRRFGLGDMLILIAALGVGISGARGLWRMQVEKPGSYWTPITPSWLMAAAMVSSMAAPLTLACLALRLRRPRPH